MPKVELLFKNGTCETIYLFYCFLINDQYV